MRGVFVVVAALAGGGACVSLAGSTGGGDQAANEAGSDATPAGDDGSSPGNDAGAEAASDGSNANDAGCPGKEGPKMIRAGSFCIDSTEVTNAQYAKFVAADASTASQSSVCNWNTSFVPSNNWPAVPGAEKVPVVYVDWCDAFAYCAWAGKRLCGRIGGGALLPAGQNDATKDQWFAACSMNGTLGYPYGNAYDANRCFTNHNGDPPDEVASHVTCEGGYPGLFDMSGNVHEWIDVCAAADGALDGCEYRGGGLEDTDSTKVACASTTGSERQSAYSTIGFRCCAD